MKVLHITPAYYPATYWGGPIFSVYALNNELAALPGIELKVLTTDAAGPKVSNRLKLKEVDGLYTDYEVIFCRRILADCVSIELLNRMLPLIRWADIVHLNAIYSFPTIPAIAICRYLHKPLVWSPHGALLEACKWKDAKSYRIKQVWEWGCNSIILTNSVTLHVTSEGEMHASLAKIPRANAEIIPNGVSALALLPSREWMPEGHLRLIFMGRLSEIKGIDRLLEAMKLMKGDKSIELTIYGTGDSRYSETLVNLAKALGLLNDTVRFAGHVDGDDKRLAFMSADICVVPSHSESFCMVVAEALGHGVPVVASQGTPWAEVEDRNCGMWVDNNPEELVRAISDMRTLNLAEMGKNGWKWMREEYDWGVIAGQMVNLYRKTI